MPIISQTQAAYRGFNVEVKKDSYRSPTGVQLKMTDSKIGGIDGMDGYDGSKEKPFVLVPVTTGVGNIVWERREMIWNNNTFGVDKYTLPAVPDESAAAQHGVAIGIETNKGTLWIQTADQNYYPTR
jgi:hypothetical protein